MSELRPDRLAGCQVLDSLSSQTKCNTFLEGCCHGTPVQAVVIGRPMRDCPPSRRWALGPVGVLFDWRCIDMCCTCFYVLRMGTMIQIRNVPDALHRRL